MEIRPQHLDSARKLDLGREAAVSLERVLPGDAEAVQEFVRGLSLQSRRERFFAPVSELTPGQLARVVSGPGLSVAAWHRGRIIGLAEYAPRAADAEFAVVVADDWRGRGLGEALVSVLVAQARSAGIQAFAGLTLAGNRAMRALARKLGFALHPDEDPALVRMERELAGA
ncbi:MAG TPA: GNAT family N-acetyltransferase [Burkholderiales bacterium]|nr:GNAT family N-acetyltransferase [Burkholderiales bacterium]